MSTSRSPALSGPSKKISSWVRPGVCEVRARLLRPVSALIREDLPTLERPANAISSPAIGGSVSIEGEAQTNCQSPANSFRPASISFASVSAVMRSSILRHGRACPGHPRSFFASVQDMDARDEPGQDEIKTKWKALETTLGSLRRFFLSGERAADIVEQLHLHAVAAHDEALRHHRERVVPGPVDHEPRREAGQHEREDQGHPGKDHLLRRIRRRRIELHLE